MVGAYAPEQLYFDTNNVNSFSDLQKTIAINVFAYLKVGSRLIYITCCIFKAENKAVVKYIVDVIGLQLEESKVTNGMKLQADSMFIAVLRKPEL